MDVPSGATPIDDDEDEMVTTSLAEILTCRNRFLEDRELWALCRECCLTLEYVHDCYDLFQSLSINPDTVAFDPEGNVCFLDLDMSPDPLYVAPELAEDGVSYKTHLYSLGMTLLYATEYNNQSDEPKAKVSSAFIDLLTSLTCDTADRRSDLDYVIEKCDKALDGELSQIICLNIIGVGGDLTQRDNAPSDDPSGILNVTGELTAYLESQSGLMQNKSADNSLLDDSKPSDISVKEFSEQNSKPTKDGGKNRDHNDNCLPNSQSLRPPKAGKGLNIIKDILKEASLDEEEIMSLNEDQSLTTPRNSKRQGMMLVDMMQSLGRFLKESELWALCRECVLCLKRKKKHLPAYVSLDTVMMCDTGMVTFKAIPEDKPLEVVYMAPELQQKGILNEKTCLYGLGITLKSAAGVDIATPSLPIQDGEALEILIQSFLQAKPDRRPALDMAFEMCQEYEKSSPTKSRGTCLALYNDALIKAALDKSSLSPSASISEMSQWDSSNKDSSKWDSSEQDPTQTSSDNTQSIFQGDATEPEDNIEDIPFDAEVKPSLVSEPKAFKPITAPRQNSATSATSSAFKPLPSKPKPMKDPYRVPSAFSSPATHFKPIILHESQTGSKDISQHGSKDIPSNANAKPDIDVVTKLREIKQNLMKHKNSDLSEKDLPNSEKPLNFNKKPENPNSDSSNLSSYMKQLKSQGNIPDTDTLASAIAKYLKNELSESSQPNSQRADKRIIQPSNASVNSNQPSSANYNHNIQASYPSSYNAPNTVNNPTLHQQPTSIPNSTTQLPYNNQQPPPMQYPGHFTGLQPQNVPSFQVTLVQDPVTGMMQMVPVPYIQVQNQPPIPPPRNAASLHGSMAITQSTSSALLYHGDGRPMSHNNPTASYGHPYQGSVISERGSGANNIQNPSSNYSIPSPHSLPNPAAHHSHSNRHSTNQQSEGQAPEDHLRAEDSHSRSSSPSPSKDSGICLTQQPGVLPYNKESLMDKFLSSENSHRKRCQSQILNIIRGEFAQEGVFDNGVEDLAMADYIMSLITLKWDTFCNAIKEKYPTLIWTRELLMLLYDTLNSPSDSRQGNRYEPSPGATSSIDKIKHYHKSGVPNQPQHTTQYTRNTADRLQTRGNDNTLPPPVSMGPNIRPMSELAVAPRIISSEASDSTDSENEKRRRFRKRYELDKKKSSSLHNVFHAANSSVPLSPIESQSSILPSYKHPKPDLTQRNPSVFSKDYYSSSQSEHESQKHHDLLNASHPPLNHRPYSQPRSDPSEPSYPSHHTPKAVLENPSTHKAALLPHPKDNSNARYNSSISNFQNGKSFQILPSKGTCDNSLYDYAESSSSNSPKEYRNNQQPSSQQKFLSPYSVPLKDSPSSPYSQLRKNKSMQNATSKSHVPLAGDHTISGSYTADKRPEMKNGRQQQQQQSQQRHSLSYMEYNDENNSDSDNGASAEMRRLAAKKPELFERRTPLMSTPIDKNSGNKIQKSHDMPTQRPHSLATKDTNDSSPLSGSKYGSTEVINLRTPGNQLNSSGEVNDKQEHDNNRYFEIRQERRTNNARYARSMSAVYASQTPKTGVQVLDKSFDEKTPRHADDSDDLPDINSALLPYTKKGQVVYHSAMIQLSLTADVDTFIHSIDEEDKSHIEGRLASVTQEINMQWKQRKKSQKLYRRLSEQSATSKHKNDQNVGGQVLKDMAEMTKRLNYLFLCKTHLQMLLAELDGLDVCYLHSLSACDHTGMMVLQPLMVNKYLQFRTVNTQQAGPMSVLQAGTPKGLLSYLYTSSALSDGFIHQFLLCFRYILTAEQMFHFIVDTYRSSRRSNQSDVNMARIQHRSLDLLQFWIEGYFSIDFAPNSHLTKRLAAFLQEQTEANIPGSDNIYSLYAACRLGEHSELMLMTEVEEDDEQDSTYFLHIANPKQTREERQMEWESFRSLLKRSKSDKSLNTSGGSGKLKSSDSKALTTSMGPKSTMQFSLADCEVHVLAEQLTLLEQGLFRNCLPVHFLNSQFQGVGVALSMPGMRTPSMTRKMEPSEPKRGLFVGDPNVEPTVVRMITHSQELAHWVSAEILSCGSNKMQTNFVSKFIGVAHMCLGVRNFATALSIREGLDNLVVRQLPVWRNISAKYITYMEELNEAKMKLKSESMWLTTPKDFHVYPTIPCALFAALHLQQMEVGGFTLANGFYKWDKMRSISETVDQLRIFRDHEYGFHADPAIQRALQRRLSEFSDQDLHAVASTHENNFHRSLSSSSSLSGTLKKMKDKIMKK